MNILVTGMSGLIGNAVRRQLEGTCAMTALNRRPVDGVPCVQADIADFEAMRPAFDNVDVVVHLAAAIQGDWDAMLPNNVIGTYNVFEASRQAGVQRVIYASSGSVVSGWEREEPYRTLVAGDPEAAAESWEMLTHETPLRPSGLYGCTKAWGEALARHYADSTDLSVICLRIGAVNAEDRPQQPRHQSVYCSQENVARLVQACARAPASLAFDIFYAVSDNPLNYRDTEHARQVLGFEPVGSASRHR
ncbi:MAG TPA: NAD(P)-dependent oxidoreductase [Candidatus Latescibacteria bacterium]|jgi:nucleoside-diphosphate-sugar epimerase|nr:NAD(P)-dependent oxidoreductase [Candidatus Latescibacterota bacterium]HJP32466.1 NAD(P)-dependent oxidoreductase [Candidatus Latescibacterota bacterium]